MMINTRAEEPILDWLYGMGMRAQLDGHDSAFSLWCSNTLRLEKLTEFP